MKNGIYIYGVIRTSPPAGEAGDPQEFGEIGIGNKASNVVTIGFKDLAVVVSRSPFKVYDSLAKEETVKDLVIHQFVIEKVMESFTIIPVKFGTMVETEGDVAKFLDKGYFLLRNAFRKIEGKIELDVVASLKLPKILAVTYRHSCKIRNKQKEIAKQGAKATTEDKIALGRLVEQELETRKTRMNNLILQTLKRKAIDVCLHDLVSDDMIFNAAFFIKKEDKDFFYTIINKLDRRFEDTLNFRVVGPLPPYSFSTILFKRISQQEVEEAQKTLGLNGEITDKLLSHAYRQLALECHPDKNAGQVFDSEVAQTRGGQLKFDLVNSAYRVLKDFTKGGFFNVDIYHWEEQR